MHSFRISDESRTQGLIICITLYLVHLASIYLRIWQSPVADARFTHPFTHQYEYIRYTEWMSHRKRRETKQQPSMLPCRAVSGCSLVSICFLCGIHSVIWCEIFYGATLGTELKCQHLTLSILKSHCRI